MYDNYNYPPGADTPSAPWNQSEPVAYLLEFLYNEFLKLLDKRRK